MDEGCGTSAGWQRGGGGRGALLHCCILMHSMHSSAQHCLRMSYLKRACGCSVVNVRPSFNTNSRFTSFRVLSSGSKTCVWWAAVAVAYELKFKSSI